MLVQWLERDCQQKSDRQQRCSDRPYHYVTESAKLKKRGKVNGVLAHGMTVSGPFCAGCVICFGCCETYPTGKIGR